MTGRIFINYRREDAQDAAARVHRELSSTFSPKALFMDVDNLLAGQRFDRELEKALIACDVFLAIIGPRWLQVLEDRQRTGERDYVREEIAAALKRQIHVVPVMVNGAQLPRESQLPEDIRELVKHQKHDLRHEHFRRDVSPLIDAIKVLRKPENGRFPLLPFAGVTAGLAAAIAVYVFGVPGFTDWNVSGPRPVVVSSPVKPESVTETAAIESSQKEEAALRERQAVVAKQRELEAADAKRRDDEAATARRREEEARLAMREAEKPAEPPEPATAVPAGNPAENWTMPASDHANQRYSALDQINVNNVKNLRQVWTFSTGVLRGHEGSPLVVDGTMYLVTPFPNYVYALDLDKEGAVKWKYQPRMDASAVVPVMCCDTVNRGVFYDSGKIYLYQADTTLVSLDAATGKEIWKVVNGDPRKGETGTNAPIVIKDKVVVGLSGSEFGVRGHVTAYSKSDGKRIWRAYAVGPDEDILMDPEKTLSLGKPVGKNSSLKTWTGDQWKIGGGTAWGWFSYDSSANLLYYGTANPSTWNAAQRAGPDGKPIDQKWTMSILARNPDTGVAAWAYQMTPFDEWSYDGVNEMILSDLDVGAIKRQALVHFDKNGLAYTLDRRTGELLVAEKFFPNTNWTNGVDLNRGSPYYGRPSVVAKYSTFLNGPDVNTKNVCPSSSGAKNQGPAAYSNLTGLFYVPVNALCMDYEPFKVSYASGQPYVGVTISMFPPEGASKRGAFQAWDAGKGKIVWSKKEDFPVWSGALTTAGGIVCYGSMEGHLKCLDQRDGKELFKYKTPSGIIGNVMTYAHKGKQYVAVLSGVGGWAGIGLAAGLSRPTDGLGMVGPMADLQARTSLGGSVVVFALP